MVKFLELSYIKIGQNSFEPEEAIFYALLSQIGR
jgi:hypothetical protein